MRALILIAAGIAIVAACGQETPARRVVDPDAGEPGPAPQAPATPSAESVQPGAPLDSLDFAVAGLPSGADSATVRRVLGAPDSVVVHDNPFDPGSDLPAWHYPDLIVHFTSDPEALGYSVTGPRYATRRGARVGDTEARIRELYGEPGVYENTREYVHPEHDMHVIRFELRDGRVAEIYLGWIMD